MKYRQNLLVSRLDIFQDGSRLELDLQHVLSLMVVYEWQV